VFIVISLFVCFTIYAKRGSSEGRFLILKISSEMICGHPLIGAGGLNSYATIYPLYQAGYFSSQNRTEKEIMLVDNVQFALNEPVQFVCELGIIGSILIFIFAYKMVKSVKINKILYSVLVAILVASCFYYILHITIFQNIFFILLLIASIRGKTIIQITSKMTVFILFLIFITSTFVAYSSIIKFIDSRDIKHKIERNYDLDDNSCHNIGKFKDNPQFLWSYAKQLFNKCDYCKCMEVLNDLNLLIFHSDVECMKGKCYVYINVFEEAKKSFITASHICPNRFEYRYELYKLYLQSDQLEEAIEVALSIRNLKEKVSSPYILAIKLEIEQFLNDKSNNRNIH
jgi:tetratricopeptide (TPR) repeat protein